MRKSTALSITLICCCAAVLACSVITAPYRVTKKAVKGTVYVVQGAYNFTAGTTNLLYKVGKFTFKVVKAPLDWPLANRDIETIDGLPPKEAIREGRVTTASYTVKGRTYHPMSVKEAENYDETGVASWYGYETVRQNHGAMTANGEAFDPKGLTAAHKHLPLPTHVKSRTWRTSAGSSCGLMTGDPSPVTTTRNQATASSMSAPALPRNWASMEQARPGSM